ncbi:MAG: UDP-N-acetylmuramate dehydrogenase [bacterium]|nr:UDP-N-acetylmuramate dehydrogenase [bacterium]
MNDKLSLIAQSFGSLRVKRDEPMALHTNNKIGGTADLYVETSTTSELVRVVRQCVELTLPFLVLGGATNVLVSDKGIRGVVIKNRAGSINIVGMKGKMVAGKKEIGDVLLEAESGTPIGHLVRFTIEEELAGLESFLGLPGTVGGAIYNNSHFQRHGKFIGDDIVQVKVQNEKGDEVVLPKSELEFDYDFSRFHHTHEVILSATFKLQKGDKAALWAKAQEASQTIRLKEQPYDIPSHGCTFQNLTKQEAVSLERPNLNQSAGALVDECGLKGACFGSAMISDKHANFIVNKGGAKASEVLAIMQTIRHKVHEQFGVFLKPEIFLLGEWTDEERLSVGAPKRGKNGKTDH